MSSGRERVDAKPRKHFYKWVVEIAVDPTWVADGFDLDDDRAHAMVANDLRYAFGHEFKCRVLSRPPDAEVAKEQGFKSTEEYLKQSDRRAASSLAVVLPPDVLTAIENYLDTDWSDGRDPSKFGALNAVAHIGERVAELIRSNRRAA